MGTRDLFPPQWQTDSHLFPAGPSCVDVSEEELFSIPLKPLEFNGSHSSSVNIHRLGYLLPFAVFQIRNILGSL